MSLTTCWSPPFFGLSPASVYSANKTELENIPSASVLMQKVFSLNPKSNQIWAWGPQASSSASLPGPGRKRGITLVPIPRCVRYFGKGLCIFLGCCQALTLSLSVVPILPSHWAEFYLWMGPLGLTGDQGPPLPGLALQNPATPPGQLLTPTSVSHTQASDTVPSCTWIVGLVPGTGSHWLVHVLCGSSSDCRTPAMWKQEVLFTWKQHCRQLFSSNKAIFSTKIKFKMCRI